MTAAHLDFWLDWAESVGGLTERDRDKTLVLLPTDIARSTGVAEQVTVTTEPDVAREEGAILLAAGHPALMHAAEQVLDAGDLAAIYLEPPRGRRPDSTVLQERARTQFQIDHGRIDATGTPIPTARSVLRVGALAEYSTGGDEQYFEQLEAWIDVPTGLPVPDAVRAALIRADWTASAEATGELESGEATGELESALAVAVASLEDQATRRQSVLVGESSVARDVESERARNYYDAVLESVIRRRDTATADQAELLDARVEVVRAEEERRLAEISDKHEPKHSLRPYRMHLLRVPTIRLDVDVRRGDRRYPLTLDYLLAARRFATPGCPSCGSGEPLVAEKTALVCVACRPARIATGTDSADAAGKADGDLHKRTQSSQHTSRSPETPSSAGSALLKRDAQPNDNMSPTGNAQPKRSVPPKGASSTAKTPSNRTPSHPLSLPPRRIIETGDRVAMKFWRAVAEQERRKVARLCAPDSPAAIAVDLFGVAGALWAIHANPAFIPESLESHTVPDTDHAEQMTAGVLLDGRDRHLFALSWRADDRNHLITEIQHGGQWWFLPRRSTVRPDAPRRELNTVEHRLLAEVYEPQTLLRCLASWRRVPDPETFADRYGPDIVAAALHRSAAYWSRSGISAAYATFAAEHDVDATELRSAGTTLQRTLHLTYERPW